ncbi:hypothetical protein K144316041_p21740 (plasmid) [Clostridium tetani]|uniref:hypothetical protein n=1 Tax=Clostridium tetani TaxID=1513 RepID=UPI0029559164|nr:hypothetical protein [Clostridium tetani]BDR74335.1 hypothetical protein K144316041_p21740 [Clostridium tetani]
MKRLTLNYKDSKVKEGIQEIIEFIGGCINEQYEYNNFFIKLENKLNGNKELKQNSRCFLDIVISKIWDCDTCTTFQELEILDKNEESVFEYDITAHSIKRTRIEFMTGKEVLNSNCVYIYNYKLLKC